MRGKITWILRSAMPRGHWVKGPAGCDSAPEWPDLEGIVRPPTDDWGSRLSHRTPDAGGCAGIVLAVERLEVIAAGIQVLAVGQAPWAAHRLAAVVADPDSGRLPAVDAQLDDARQKQGHHYRAPTGAGWPHRRSAPSVPVSGQPSLSPALPRRIGHAPQGPPSSSGPGRLLATQPPARVRRQVQAAGTAALVLPWRPPVLFAQVRDVANGRQGLG